MKIHIIPKYKDNIKYTVYTTDNEIDGIFIQGNQSAMKCGIYINEKLTLQLPGREIVHNIQNFISIFLMSYNSNFSIINIETDNESNIEYIKDWEVFNQHLTVTEQTEFSKVKTSIDINNKTLIYLLTCFKQKKGNDEFKLVNFEIRSFLKIKDIIGV